MGIQRAKTQPEDNLLTHNGLYRFSPTLFLLATNNFHSLARYFASNCADLSTGQAVNGRLTRTSTGVSSDTSVRATTTDCSDRCPSASKLGRLANVRLRLNLLLLDTKIFYTYNTGNCLLDNACDNGPVGQGLSWAATHKGSASKLDSRPLT